MLKTVLRNPLYVSLLLSKHGITDLTAAHVQPLIILD